MQRLALLLAVLLLRFHVQGATIPALSVAQDALYAAIALASDGDTITAPPSSAVYTTPFACNKKLIFAFTPPCIVTNAMQTGGGDPTACAAMILWPAKRISGLTIVGNGGAAGLLFSANTRVDHCNFYGLKWANYCFGALGGVIDHCNFTNNFICMQVVGATATGAAEWSRYPIAFDSMNYMFMEDCVGVWNSDFWAKDWGQAPAASGQGSSYVVRHCTFYSTAGQFAPGFDAHGDAADGTHGNLSVQIYANDLFIWGPSAMDKFADIRGGQGQIYSNSVHWAGGTTAGSVRGVSLREEHPLDFPLDPEPHDLVTNMWVWSNTVNGVPMPTFVDDSLGMIQPGVQYFTKAPATVKAPPYPHPLVAARLSAPSGLRVTSR